MKVLKIQYHPMKEKPTLTCRVIVCTRWNTTFPTDYSGHYCKFGVRDTTEPEAVETEAIDESLYIGWIYEDELAWAMWGKVYETL